MIEVLTYSLRVGIDLVSRIFRFVLISIRRLGLSRDVMVSRFNVRTNQPPRIFNLDLHVSIIADLKSGAVPLDLSVTSWSISGANRVFRKVLWAPDPVEVINATTWQKLNSDMIQDFRHRYNTFLRSFDGFVVTHTPFFAEIYDGLDKPVLAVAGTRYEWPLTLDRNRWKSFDEYIKSSTKSGKLFLVANNMGDTDYLQFHTGVTPRYVPSLCEYTGQNWDGLLSHYLVVARSTDLINQVSRITNNLWVDSQSVLGKNYSWADLARGKAIFVVPYNISTMTLFELATMGVPVVVPSPRLLKILRHKFSGVLSELSFMEMNSMHIDGLGKDDPNNFLSESYLDWWLNRADFYNSMLMPNVFVIDELEELNYIHLIFDKHFSVAYKSSISDRNASLFDTRRSLLGDFIDAL